jgi:hypothetical protein
MLGLVLCAQTIDLKGKWLWDEIWLVQQHKNKKGGHRSDGRTKGKGRSEMEYEGEHKDSATKLDLLD